MSEIFVHQDFNDFGVVQNDDKDLVFRLSTKQLAQIRQEGHFDTERKDFPGHLSNWHICRALQKGTTLIKERLNKVTHCSVKLIKSL